MIDSVYLQEVFIVPPYILGFNLADLLSGGDHSTVLEHRFLAPGPKAVSLHLHGRLVAVLVERVLLEVRGLAPGAILIAMLQLVLQDAKSSLNLQVVHIRLFLFLIRAVRRFSLLLLVGLLTRGSPTLHATAIYRVQSCLEVPGLALGCGRHLDALRLYDGDHAKVPL